MRPSERGSITTVVRIPLDGLLAVIGFLVVIPAEIFGAGAGLQDAQLPTP